MSFPKPDDTVELVNWLRDCRCGMNAPETQWPPSAAKRLRSWHYDLTALGKSCPAEEELQAFVNDTHGPTRDYLQDHLKEWINGKKVAEGSRTADEVMKLHQRLFSACRDSKVNALEQCLKCARLANGWAAWKDWMASRGSCFAKKDDCDRQLWWPDYYQICANFKVCTKYQRDACKSGEWCPRAHDILQPDVLDRHQSACWKAKRSATVQEHATRRSKGKGK